MFIRTYLAITCSHKILDKIKIYYCNRKCSRQKCTKQSIGPIGLNRDALWRFLTH